MYKNEDEKVVFPAISTLFGERDKDKNILPFTETRLYKDNLFGLKTLHEQ
jgi:hypothetical protein